MNRIKLYSSGVVGDTVNHAKLTDAEFQLILTFESQLNFFFTYVTLNKAHGPLIAIFFDLMRNITYAKKFKLRIF